MAEAVDEESVRKFVAAYLKKKGFKQTEDAFQDELNKNTNSSSSPISFNSKLDPDVSKHILSFSQCEEGPAQYQDVSSTHMSFCCSFYTSRSPPQCLGLSMSI